MATFVLAEPSVSTGWKWLAVVIAVAAILVLFALVALEAPAGTKSPSKWVQDPNNVPSTSKFQWLLWLVVVLFSYITLWVIRAKQGDYSALPDIPNNVLIVLGVSTLTMASAKG